MPHGRPRHASHVPSPSQAAQQCLKSCASGTGKAGDSRTHERPARPGNGWRSACCLAGTIGRMPDATETSQPRNPLHGMTLEAIVLALQARYGWAGLAERVPVRCFSHDASVASSLKFLRKTPWAREKVESLYLFMLRDERRAQRPPG